MIELRDLQFRSDLIQDALVELNAFWDLAQSPVSLHEIERIWAQYDKLKTIEFLVELIKTDQSRRIEFQHEIDLHFYLDHFPELANDHARVISLAYSEFCVIEDHGQTLNIDHFCNKYEVWGESIRCQLEIHKLLSIPSNEILGNQRPHDFPKVGDEVEHFRLDREIGRGGSARVYLANDLSLGNRRVALKVSGDCSTEPEILARLDHDHIVPILSVHDSENGLRLICMPYHGGVTFDHLFRDLYYRNRQTPKKAKELWSILSEIDPGEPESSANFDHTNRSWIQFPERGGFTDAVAWLGWKIALALDHAHHQNIFHRDIKPANILISRKAGPLLLDFNMARDPQAVNQIEDRIRGGTLPYMAPEQLAAFLDATLWAEISGKSDIYSLGLVLKEFISGERVEPPLAGNASILDQVRGLLRQRSIGWVSQKDSNRNISSAWDAVLSKSLAFSPCDRYQNASQFADDLKCIIEKKPLKWAWNRSRKERWGVKIRPFRKYLVLGLFTLICYLILMAWRPVPVSELAIPGVSNTLLQSLKAGQYQSVSKLLESDENASSQATSMEIIRMIVEIELSPGNVLAQDRINQLVKKPDLDESCLMIQGAIGKNRHLEFLPVYRDYCRLALLQSKGTTNPLEWQDLERRFFHLQNQWPDDLRTYGFLAYLASMRSDYQTAFDQADQGLKVISSHPGASSDAIRGDLLEAKIKSRFQLGTVAQRSDHHQSALELYELCLKDVRLFQSTENEALKNPACRFRIIQLELLSEIGVGDIKTDQLKYDEALAKYLSGEALLDQNHELFRWNESYEKFRSDLDLRIRRISELDKSSGLINLNSN